MREERLFERDYYPPTKLIGAVARRLSAESLRSRVVIAISIFGFTAFGIPTIVGLAVNDFLFDGWEILIAFVWLAVAPILIDAFEFTVDKFWMEYEKRVEMEREEFEDFKRKMNHRIFSKKYLLFSGAFYVFFFLLMGDVLAGHSLIIVAVVDVLMVPAALMWGIIAHTVVSIYPFMKEVCSMRIRLDIFDPDGFGGLGVIGNVALRVTAFVSSASLYIPFGFIRASTESLVVASAAVLGLVVLMCGIALTFLLTVLPVNRLAKERRAKLLGFLGKELSHRLEKFGREDTGMEKDIELLLALESYREVKAMRVWPFNPINVVNIFGLLLLPVILFLAGIYL